MLSLERVKESSESISGVSEKGRLDGCVQAGHTFGDVLLEADGADMIKDVRC